MKAPSPAARTFRMAVIACAGLVFFMPLWWVFVSSVRPEDDIFRYLNPLSAWTFVPNRWTLEHVVTLWTSPFARAILNSVLVAAATVGLGLTVCALAAFALAVIPFRGRTAVFAIMVVSFLIPFDAVAVPLFDIFRRAGLQNSYTGLILPGIGNGLAIFLLRQFFTGIPRELSEAAMVDGMGWFQVFWRIYLPLSVPALISAALIMFIFQWQAYLWPLLIAPGNDYKVAAVAIAQFASAYDVNFGVIFAGAMFVSLIPMLVLVGFQRYFTTSVAATGGKE